jgi:hypothetical protein
MYSRILLILLLITLSNICMDILANKAYFVKTDDVGVPIYDDNGIFDNNYIHKYLKHCTNTCNKPLYKCNRVDILNGSEYLHISIYELRQIFSTISLFLEISGTVVCEIH